VSELENYDNGWLLGYLYMVLLNSDILNCSSIARGAALPPPPSPEMLRKLF